MSGIPDHKTPLQFYTEKAADIGIAPYDLCDHKVLLMDKTIKSEIDGLPKFSLIHNAKITLYHSSKKNPAGLVLSAAVKLDEPDLEAIDQGTGVIQDIDDVLHRDYRFALNDYTGTHNNFVEITIRNSRIRYSEIREKELTAPSKIHIPKELFEPGRNYRDGLTWMLKQYAGR